MAWDEIPLYPSPGVNPDVERVLFSGDNAYIYGDTRIGVWTVPAGVTSFSFVISGGGGYDSIRPEDVPIAGPVPAAFFDVPCTPGDEWLLEGGDGIYDPNTLLASQRNTFPGGDGYYPGTGTNAGLCGGGASVLRRRNGSGTLIAAVAAGWGGPWVGPTGSIDVPVAGGVSTGGFIAEPGSVTPGGASSAGGGGGGGIPGGAAGASTGDAGSSGDSYLPGTPYSSLGGEPSPTRAEVDGASGPFPVTSLGGVVIWYYRPLSAGWSIDEIKF